MTTVTRQTTRAYPKIMYRWIGDILPAGAAYSAGSLAMRAVEKGVLRQEHAQRVRIMAGRFVEKVGIAAETTIEPHGVPIDGWRVETWKRVLYQQAPAATRRLKYRFLIEKAVDGEAHHASSLAWMLTTDEARETEACNLATGRHEASRWLSKLRRNLIKVDTISIRGVHSERKTNATYPAWDAAVWKSAAEIPGYYGLHVPIILGKPPKTE